MSVITEGCPTSSFTYHSAIVVENPITNFDEANLVTEDWEEDEPMTEFGRIEDMPLLLHPGTVRVYHSQCDSRAKPWVRLSSVLRNDQRYCLSSTHSSSQVLSFADEALALRSSGSAPRGDLR